jgi:alpha-tubulin suppressor-like RCC1 family protein
VAYASFGPFAGSGAISENSEIDASIPIWNSLQVKGNTVVSIATGVSHSLAVTSLGRVFAWGSDGFGQLGNGSSSDSDVATPEDITLNFSGLVANEKIVSVSAGQNHSLAVTSLGKVFAWGKGVNNQVGDATGQNRTSPVNITSRFGGLETNEIVVSLSGGAEFSVALTSLGKVFSWGNNSWWQLGNAGGSSWNAPGSITARFSGLSENEKVISIASGSQHSIALTSLGKVFTWGQSAASGAEGTGNTSGKSAPFDITDKFLELSDREKIVSIEAGWNMSYAVTSLGKVFAFGGAQIGHPNYGSSPQNITAQFSGLTTNEKIIRVAKGRVNSIAITSLGKIFSWGSDSDGQLGNGSDSTSDVANPQNILPYFTLAPFERIVSVSIGSYHCLATSSLGKVFAWGSDSSGRLGNGANGNASSPENITANFDDLNANEKICMISSGSTHSIALTTLGKVFAWGSDGSGQLGNGGANSNANSPENITASFAGLATGEIVTSIAAGGSHSLALTSLGKVFAWGGDSYGQLGNGGANSNANSPENITASFAGLATGEIVTSIAAGESHSLALTSLGKVFAWGDAYRGQLGNGSSGSSSESVTTPENVTANFVGLATGEIVTTISAGGSGGHSLALTSLGKVFAFGSNSYGQLGTGTTTNASLPENITAKFTGLAAGEIVTSVDAGGGHSLALTSLGKVFAWGYNYRGQLGNGSASGAVTTLENITANFAELITNEIVTSIVARANHSLAVTSLGKVFAWGRNDYEQLGKSSSGADIRSPENITANFAELVTNEIVSPIIGGTSDFSFFVTSIGKVFACGNNSYGQLGNGATAYASPLENITANFAL